MTQWQCNCCGEYFSDTCLSVSDHGDPVCRYCHVGLLDFRRRLEAGETCMCGWPFCRCGKFPPTKEEIAYHQLALTVAHEYLTVERATEGICPP